MNNPISCWKKKSNDLFRPN